jgi:hypothetical protein
MKLFAHDPSKYVDREPEPVQMPTKSTRLVELNRYLRDEIHQINGWCHPQLWQTLWPLAHRIGPGRVAEIGVFEGKFFIGLCKTFETSADAPAVAIDVFDMQEFNLDNAGVGKKDVFLANADRYGIEPKNVECWRVDSLSLRRHEAQRFIEERGRVAFFSVDGCHEVLHTMRDIEFAMEVVDHRGVIAVDDYTNPSWPGVSEAVARMYLMGNYPFVPLAVTCNKLLLCSYSFHRIYLAAVHAYILKHHTETRMKKVSRFGYDTLTIAPNLQRWTNLVDIH